VRGAADDVALKARQELRTRGIPVVISCASAVLALRERGIQRLALIDPPWFSVELDQLGAEYFGHQAFEVIYNGPAELPAEQRAVHPGQLYEWLRSHTPKNAEAVFIGGNGLRAIGVIHTLEEDLGRPLLTANQVAFWHALRLSGARVCRFPITAAFSISPRRRHEGAHGSILASFVRFYPFVAG
jgi:maleate isomerase